MRQFKDIYKQKNHDSNTNPNKFLFKFSSSLPSPAGEGI
jgi:hypothetical protein